MIRAALTGRLDQETFEPDPVFKIEVPRRCPDVPSEILQPRATWAAKSAFDEKAKELALRFAENFKAFEADANADVKEAAPRG